MGEPSPKLRQDLIIRRRDGGGEAAFVIKDPRSRRYFHFREPEVFIAQRFDGMTPLEEIRLGAEQRFGLSLSEQSLQAFLGTLHTLGLLESPSPQLVLPRGKLRTRGSLLYLRWKLCDPDRLLGWMATRLRWLFSPIFISMSMLMILFAIGVTVVNYGAIGNRFPELLRPDFIFFAWLTMIFVLTCHEFAHGVTCRHFGGRVHEMGFMLIFFHPAFYCNVSDAWLFPELRKRLWVTFAGAYFEIFLWALATLVWWVADPNTLLSSLALIVMLTSGVKTLFNLNPLIKLDGYYLLSDWLRVPNLNRRAIGFVRARLQGCFRRNPSTSVGEPLPRERRIFLYYGSLALLFSICLLTWIVGSLGSYLTTRFQAAGFVATSGLVLALVRRPIIRTSASPARETATSERRTRTRRRILYLLMFSGLIAALLLIRMELTIAAPFTVRPVNYADVRARVAGIVDSVHVDENDRVLAEQSILQLSDHDFRLEFEKVEADLAATIARLNMLKSGARKEEIELARRELDTAKMRYQRANEQFDTEMRVREERLSRASTSIEKAETQLRAAQIELERIEEFVARRIASAKEQQDAEALVALREKELQEARGDLRVASAEDLAYYREAAVVAGMELKEAEGRLNLLLAGSRAELIEAAEAEAARLETQRDHLQQQMRYLNIVTPITGVITTPKLHELVSRRVEKGDLIATVHDFSRFQAEIVVPEKEMADVAIGQSVLLKARAFPGTSFHARITSIAPIASTDENLLVGRAVLVSADIEEPIDGLKPEMTGNGKICCGQRRLLDVLTRRLVRYIRVEFWSWW